MNNKVMYKLLILLVVASLGYSDVNYRLTAQYKFDGNLEDTSGNNIGSATSVGTSYAQIDGIQALKTSQQQVSYINIPEVVVNGKRDFSITFYVKSAISVQNTQYLMSWQRDDVPDKQNLAISTEGVEFKRRDSSLVTQFSYIDNQILDTQQWQHVCFVRDTQAGYLRVYKNGLLIGSQKVLGGNDWSPMHIQEFYLGALYNSTSSFQENINQQIDGYFSDFRVYSRIFQQQDVQEVMESNALLYGLSQTPILEESAKVYAIDSDLVAHYKLDGDLNDSSLNGHGRINITEEIFGDLRFGNKNIRVPQFTKEKIREGSIPVDVINGLTDFSVSVWAKGNPDPQGNHLVIFSMEDVRSYYGQGIVFSDAIIRQTGPEKLNWYVVRYRDSRIIQNNQEWVHITFVRDTLDKQLRVYRNGRLYASLDVVDTEPINTKVFNLGAPYWPVEVWADKEEYKRYQFDGYMYDLRVFKRALDQQSIDQLINDQLITSSL